MRERFLTPRLRFKNLEEFNAWLLDQVIAYAGVHRHPEQSERTVWEMFEAERGNFIPYAGRFDASIASWPRCRRPAWFASTTTDTRCFPAPSAVRRRSKPMPTASSSVRMAWLSASISVP